MAVTFIGYELRYSMFDSLLGEIDAQLYTRITQVTTFEKRALMSGALITVLGLATGVAASITLGKKRHGATSQSGLPRGVPPRENPS